MLLIQNSTKKCATTNHIHALKLVLGCSRLLFDLNSDYHQSNACEISMRPHNFTSCSWMLFDVIVGSAQHHIADLLIITTQVTPAAVPKGKRLKYDLCIQQDFRRNVLWENKYNEYIHVYMSHSQMLGKFEYTLPAKFWRLVGCTEMLSW